MFVLATARVQRRMLTWHDYKCLRSEKARMNTALEYVCPELQRNAEVQLAISKIVEKKRRDIVQSCS